MTAALSLAHRRPNTTNGRSARRGLAIGAIIAAIALAGFLAVAYATSNQSASSLTGQQSNKTQATTITTMGTNVGVGYSAMLTRGYTISDISFKGGEGYGPSDSTEPDKQMFHPSSGTAVVPITPASALDSPGTSDVWHFWTTNVRVASAGGTELGTNASDAVVVLPKVKLGICQQINNQLNGVPIADTPISGNVTLADLQQIAPSSALTIYTRTGTDAPRTEACLATTDGTPSYFYIKVMQIQ